MSPIRFFLSLAILATSLSSALARPPCSRHDAHCIKKCHTRPKVSPEHTTPVPEITTTPVPEITTTPVPEATTTPIPEATTTPVPEATTTPVPETTPETTPPTTPKPTAPKPTPTTIHEQATPTPAGSTSASDIQAYLSAHNDMRAKHGAKALTWSNELASKAQEWANKCVFEHSGGSLGPYGGRLKDCEHFHPEFSLTIFFQKIWLPELAISGSMLLLGPGMGRLVSGFNHESTRAAFAEHRYYLANYDPSNPQPSHFTQVVWKKTTQVGCAVQSCSGIFDASFGVRHDLKKPARC